MSVHIPHPSVSLVFWYLQEQSTEPGLFLHSNLALGHVEMSAHSSISIITHKSSCAIRLLEVKVGLFFIDISCVGYLCSCVRLRQIQVCICRCSFVWCCSSLRLCGRGKGKEACTYLRWQKTTLRSVMVYEVFSKIDNRCYSFATDHAQSTCILVFPWRRCYRGTLHR